MVSFPNFGREIPGQGRNVQVLGLIWSCFPPHTLTIRPKLCRMSGLHLMKTEAG